MTGMKALCPDNLSGTSFYKYYTHYYRCFILLDYNIVLARRQHEYTVSELVVYYYRTRLCLLVW